MQYRKDSQALVFRYMQLVFSVRRKSMFTPTGVFYILSARNE